MLRIPPMLLGLSSVTLYEWGSGSALPAPVAHAISDGGAASAATMLEYERLLAMSWELYYTSTVQKAAASIEESHQKLLAASEHASGVGKDQYDAMLCRFYQLSSLVARDQMDFARSVEDEHKAVEIAFRLKNAERIDDAHSALAIAREHLSPEQNRWKVNLLLSEARAYLAEKDVTSCCEILNEAISIIRAIHLSAKEDRVRSLLEQRQQLEPQNPAVHQLETWFSSQSV